MTMPVPLPMEIVRSGRTYTRSNWLLGAYTDALKCQGELTAPQDIFVASTSGHTPALAGTWMPDILRTCKAMLIGLK